MLRSVARRLVWYVFSTGAGSIKQNVISLGAQSAEEVYNSKTTRLYCAEDAAGEEYDDYGASGAEDDAERLKDLASEAPLIRLVNQIIAQAVESRASDIHIEPFEDRLRVRYRCRIRP